MSSSSKRELLLLVEALCEERASAAETARLEELVLSDKELLRLYTEAITLHGLLYWDAAGRGAEIRSDSSIVPPVDVSSGRGNDAARRRFRLSSPWRWRRVREVATGLAILVILKLGFAYFQPSGLQMARQNPTPQEQLPDQDSEPEVAQTRTSPDSVEDEAHIRGIRLSRESKESPFSDRRVDDSSLADNPATAPSQFRLRSNEEVVQRINQHLQNGWTQAGVVPAGRADDAEWVRRVYLDLAGRIPTAKESQSFFDSASEDKRKELVASLVSGRDFSRRLATVWANLLVGRSRQTVIDREELLSWLDDQFFSGRSWQEVVTDLVAARGTSRTSGPANFLLAHLNNEAVPATAITARIFLCEQLQCTQCHQHPVVKSWGQERFWELNAFFQQAQIRELSVRDPVSGKVQRERVLVDAETFGPTYYETLRGVMRVAYPRFAGVEINKEIDRDHPSLRTQLARLLFAEKHPQPARAFVNRTWALLMGRGFTFPVDDMGPHTPVSHPELLEDLTAAFVQSGYDVQRLTCWICLSDAYQQTSRLSNKSGSTLGDVGDRPLFEQMVVKTMSAEQLFDSLQIASGVAPERLRSRGVQQQRDQWLRQLYVAVETEENGESSTFDGSWQQALLMMNGDLVQQAVSTEPGGVLARATAEYGTSEADRIRQLSLAALSRYPEASELAQLRTLVRRTVRQRVTEDNLSPQRALSEGLKDLYWAYLNSTEFAQVH